MKTLREFEDKAKTEIDQELEVKAVAVLKERLRELQQARQTLSKLEKQYEELLNTNAEDLVIQNCCYTSYSYRVLGT